MNFKRKCEIRSHLSKGDARYEFVKPPNLRSNIWQNFDLIQFDGKLEDFARCKKCKDVVSYSTKTGTGGLIRHNCDNQNNRCNSTKNHIKQQKAKKYKFSAARQASMYKPRQPNKVVSMDYVQSETTPEGLNEHNDDSKKCNYGEAVDDTPFASVQQDSNLDDPNDIDYVYREYVDMGNQIEPESNQVNSGGDIDDDVDDDADNEDDDMDDVGDDDGVDDVDDDDQSPVDDVHCNDEDVTTPNFNLMELLMQSNEGQNALSYYDLHNHLNVKHREVVFNTLIDIINSSSECKKYNENLRRISYELRQLFPMENYSTLELHKYSMRLEMGEIPQEEDLKLYNLLNSWSLAHLYDHFRAENITFDVVKIMETKHIDRLFKNLTIGDNVLFDYHFFKWLENGSPEPFTDVNLNPEHQVLSSSQNRDVHNESRQDWKQNETLSSNEELDIEADVGKKVIETKKPPQQPQQQPPQHPTTTSNRKSRYFRPNDRTNFDVDNVVRAIRAVHSKIHPVAIVAQLFKIPRSTLYTYMNKLSIYHDLNGLNDYQLVNIINDIHYSYNAFPGSRVFSDEQEEALVSHIKNRCDHYNALSLNELGELAYKFAKENNFNCPISWEQEKRTGKTWCQGFMRRHSCVFYYIAQQTGSFE